MASYYQLQRRQSSRNKSRTTVRLLDSLVRLSQGHARLLFHESVQIIDAVMAVILVEIGMGYQEDSILNLDMNVHSSFPDDSINSYVELLNNVLEKLNLHDILEQEINSLHSEIDSLNCGNEITTKSRYFQSMKNKEPTSNRDSNIIERDDNKHEEDKETLHNSEMERSIFQDDNSIDNLDLNI